MKLKGGPPQALHDRGYCCRIGAEVGMEVFDTQHAQAPHKPRRLEPISDVADFLSNPWAAEPSRRQCRTKGSSRPRKKQHKRSREERCNSVPEHNLRALRFAPVGWILQPSTRLPDRETMDLITRALDRFNLAPDEGVADRRIDVAEIG